eukprot:1195207-Prorocentrum_minimum.AAC.1
MAERCLGTMLDAELDDELDAELDAELDTAMGWESPLTQAASDQSDSWTDATDELVVADEQLRGETMDRRWDKAEAASSDS